MISNEHMLFFVLHNEIYRTNPFSIPRFDIVHPLFTQLNIYKLPVTEEQLAPQLFACCFMPSFYSCSGVAVCGEHTVVLSLQVEHRAEQCCRLKPFQMTDHLLSTGARIGVVTQMVIYENLYRSILFVQGCVCREPFPSGISYGERMQAIKQNAVSSVDLS